MDSTSPVPKTPWPVLNFQLAVSILPFAGPLKGSDQASRQGRAEGVGEAEGFGELELWGEAGV
jgi:hypothetical protein